MDTNGVTSILVLLLFTVSVTAQSEDIAVDECAAQCAYDETAGEYVMNCTQRQCTNTPKVVLQSTSWTSYNPLKYMMTLNLKENQSKINKLKNVLHYITVQMFVTLKKTATSQGKYPD